MVRLMNNLAVVVLLLSLQERSEGRLTESIDGHRQKLSDELETGFQEDNSDDMRKAARADWGRGSGRPLMASASKFTQSEKDAIVKQHNQERGKTGGNDMLTMTWDEDLARLAQGLSDTCRFKHDNLQLPGGERVGQNLAWSSRMNEDVTGMAQGWINEKRVYDLRSGSCRGVCGHYTQMVWSKTDKIGCGKTSCTHGKRGTILVCDYSPAGNFNGEKPVNFGGAPCSKCNFKSGTRCNDGLCEACNTPGSADCRAYDSSQCVDAKHDCGWVQKYCRQSMYKPWLEQNCAKTCGYC